MNYDNKYISCVVSALGNSPLFCLVEYNGILRENGNLVDGDREIMVKLFDGEESESILCSQKTTVNIVGGVYTISIGQDQWLPWETLHRHDVYMSIEIGNEQIDERNRLIVGAMSVETSAIRSYSSEGIVSCYPYVFRIPSWDMDEYAQLVIPYDNSISGKVVSMAAMIISDDNDTQVDFSSYEVKGSMALHGLDIVLRRDDASICNSADYRTRLRRGRMTLWLATKD